MQNEIFRKDAMDRLSSPEQLDRLIRVTSPRYWIALIAAGVLVVFSILWGVTGEVTVRENVSGALVSSGGIFQITSHVSGKLTDIRVKPGDSVKKGDIVARIDQGELVDRITALMQEIENDKAGGKAVGDKEKQLAALREQLEYESTIVSAEEGRAVEIFSEVGAYVQVGSKVMSVSVEGAAVKQLVAVMYVPVNRGKILKPGMEVNIYPSVTKKEEYGYMMGRISSVSGYPVNEQDIRNMVGSDKLASQFTADTAVLEVNVDLVPSDKTVSGFKWSTSEGPPVRIESGTLCSGDVIIGKTRPIEMVIPALGKLLGKG